MKNLLPIFVASMVAVANAAPVKAHNEADEELRISPELMQKTDFNMAAGFRLAYVGRPLKVNDRVAWTSPSSGKTTMKLTDIAKQVRIDTDGVDPEKLKDKEIANDPIALFAVGGVLRNGKCYSFKVQEKDLAPRAEIARSARAIKEGNYAHFERNHIMVFCIEPVPIKAWSKDFMKANAIPDETIRQYQKLFPEGTQIPYRVAIGGGSETGKTPKAP